LAGVAVKVTEVPEHTGLEEAVIDTLTGRIGLTVISISFDVAGFPVAQVAFEVRMQVTLSVLIIDVLV
jgi:hypothetical protein